MSAIDDDLDDVVYWARESGSDMPSGGWIKGLREACAKITERDEALRARIRTLERELKLAIAHDRQPYPTAEAYEKACAALNKKTARVEKLLGILKAVEWEGNYDDSQKHAPDCGLKAALEGVTE